MTKDNYDGNIALTDEHPSDAELNLKAVRQSGIGIEDEVPRNMGTFKTYFALLKAYCAINVLLLPLSFKNGGYILSPIMMVIACFFETLCAIRLSAVANKYKIWTYPGIAMRAMGNPGF